MAEWISVKDRLPEKEKPVLVYNEHDKWWPFDYCVAEIDEDGFWMDEECCVITPTHWMPLPEPPKLG